MQNDPALPGGNATLHPETSHALDLLAMLWRENELQDLLETIEVNAESIWSWNLGKNDDDSGPAAWEILKAVERLEDLLLCATGLREARP